MSFNVLHDIWWALIMIGIMILIHELGHYWAARFFDVKVDTFSFGFGPRLFGFKKGETDFRFSLILLGGYVKMVGEHGDEHANDPRSFLSKPRWQRLIIVFAGPAMNIILAVAVLTGLFMVQFPKIPSSPSPEIGYIVPNSAAAKAGLHEGDRIVQIGDAVNPNWEDIYVKEVASAGHPLSVWIVRNGERKPVTVTPVLDPKTGAGFAGWGGQSDIEIAGFSHGDSPAAKAGLKTGDIMVSVDGQPIHSTPKVHDIINSNGGKPVDVVFSRNGTLMNAHLTPAISSDNGTKEWLIGVKLQPKVVLVSLPFPQALRESVRENTKNATFIYQFLRGVAERRMSPRSLEGPLRIVQISGEEAREGAIPYLGLMAGLSLNLAVVNLLPIPILDGATIFMLLVEMFMRRDLSLRVKETAFRLGFVFLMAVVAFVLYNDISKLAG